jgi:hypothetical protein
VVFVRYGSTPCATGGRLQGRRRCAAKDRNASGSPAQFGGEGDAFFGSGGTQGGDRTGRRNAVGVITLESPRARAGSGRSPKWRDSYATPQRANQDEHGQSRYLLLSLALIALVGAAKLFAGAKTP